MNDFVEMLKKETDQSILSTTENGALGYKTSGKALVDLNFALSSMRHWSDEDIVEKWIPAYFENEELAIRWLFYIRDVRGGLGERRVFRVILKYMANNHPAVIANIITSRTSFTLQNGPLVPFFGRWDDLLALFDTPLEGFAISCIITQLNKDIQNAAAMQPISVCVKWVPSINAGLSSRRKANKIRKAMHLKPTEYQKMLSGLRSYIDVTERKTKPGRWGEIKYPNVPSKANLRYKHAFLKHDHDRRVQYLESVSRGEAKINASTVYPYEIYYDLRSNFSYDYSMEKDHNITVQMETMWKALPDVVQGQDMQTLVVCDSSGSMDCKIGNSRVRALDVSESMAVYFSERMSGPFANSFITFSANPRLVQFKPEMTLLDKMKVLDFYAEAANTNIYRVFQLILETAVNNKLTQEDLPKRILIISDMEFDYASDMRYDANENLDSKVQGSDQTLFEYITDCYELHGYHLPKLVFWNVNSRSMTIPVCTNKYGFALVSGFSPNIVKMVMSDKLDPYEILKDQLMDARYAVVADAMKGGFVDKPGCNFDCNNCNQS